MLPSGDTEVVLFEIENPHKTMHFSLSLEEGGGTHKASFSEQTAAGVSEYGIFSGVTACMTHSELPIAPVHPPLSHKYPQETPVSPLWLGWSLPWSVMGCCLLQAIL